VAHTAVISFIASSRVLVDLVADDSDLVSAGFVSTMWESAAGCHGQTEVRAMRLAKQAEDAQKLASQPLETRPPGREHFDLVSLGPIGNQRRSLTLHPLRNGLLFVS
jgi:hypothetical protein